MVHDAVIISDVHLGSDVCQSHRLDCFLNKIMDRKIRTKRLVVNGDLFDSLDFRRLPKGHWKILKDLRSLSGDIETIWICGNHDGHYEAVGSLIGLDFSDEYEFETGGFMALCTHGHRYDTFIQSHPILTKAADSIYWLMQKIDNSHTLAIYAKQNSKTFLRNSRKIRSKAVEDASTRGCKIVCCGHTHQAETTLCDGIWYGNSGCWTDSKSSWLSVSEGALSLHIE